MTQILTDSWELFILLLTKKFKFLVIYFQRRETAVIELVFILLHTV